MLILSDDSILETEVERMKNKTKFSLIITLSILGLYIAGKYVINQIFGNMCENRLIEMWPSPKENKTAYIFERDCGATTGYSYHLSLLDSDEELPNSGGNTFVSDSLFEVEWVTNNNLHVRYNQFAETFEKDRFVNWTKIEYVD